MIPPTDHLREPSPSELTHYKWPRATQLLLILLLSGAVLTGVQTFRVLVRANAGVAAWLGACPCPR